MINSFNWLQAQVRLIWDELRNLKKNSSGGGTDYIPLTGTEEGKPVTGNIEVSMYSAIIKDNPDSVSLIQFNGPIISITNYSKTTDQSASITIYSDSIEVGTVLPNGLPGVGLTSFNDSSEVDASNKLIYAQRSYVDKANSYSTDEIKTGGTWIDDKDIYTITQPTVDTPPTMDTAFPTEVIGTYTVYKYTKP